VEISTFPWHFLSVLNGLRRKVELAAAGGGNEKNNAFLSVPEMRVLRK
jgi:hypothetical protein